MKLNGGNMTIKELIQELQKYDENKEVVVSVYDCNGYDDSHGIYLGRTPENPEDPFIIEIAVGCDTHSRWVTERNCKENSSKK